MDSEMWKSVALILIGPMRHSDRLPAYLLVAKINTDVG